MLDLHGAIEHLAGIAYDPYVTPILVCPDIVASADIEQLAKRKGGFASLGERDPVAGR